MPTTVETDIPANPRYILLLGPVAVVPHADGPANLVQETWLRAGPPSLMRPNIRVGLTA